MNNNNITDEILEELPAEFNVYLNKEATNLSQILRDNLKQKKAPAGLAQRILDATVNKEAA